jgi:DNA repair protein RadD
MYTLRPYQQEAVHATLSHFRKDNSPAVIVLPTGAGKSLVIAELARIALGRVLVLAHVKELVEQNHAKFLSFKLSAGIYSAGLNRKDMTEKVIFGSIQSIARASEDFYTQNVSLLIIDECHRISMEGDTQYFQVISKLKAVNPQLCILGLTATPYRLGQGWIYEYNSHKKLLRTKTSGTRFFKKCIYELSLGFMIKNKYLTPPVKIDSPVACYDFSSLKLNAEKKFQVRDIEHLLKDQKRITPMIIQNIINMSVKRKGVMIFTSSVAHAEEILRALPPFISAMVVGETESKERSEIIEAFKEQKLKYLVNVSVLTTGFDAPHVDVIALLRPTESVSLYQQIIGRGLRLAPHKDDCLILDYTGQGHDIFSPEIGEDKQNPDSIVVEVACPECGLINHFWGVCDDEGNLVEHYGRKCQGASEIIETQQLVLCPYRFRFKRCDACGCEQDIAARTCSLCKHLLIDNDKKLKEAMALKDAHVMRVETMNFESSYDKQGRPKLIVKYFDADAESLSEVFYLETPEDAKAFYFNFIRMHNRLPEKLLTVANCNEAITKQSLFRPPLFIIARKDKHFWKIREKIF